MASPLTTKYKWPSQKGASAGDMAADFVPYISNLVNTFRKVPRPKAPKLVDPVTGTRISLADAKRQVSDQTRAADLSTQDLDAQTGAAIRVGNIGSKFRALSDLNSREAQINAQMSQQTKSINASIDAQNAATTNAYQDDQVNAEMAQQRMQSENIANAADKFIAQSAVRDQAKLEKEKATIYSKMYNPGVYNRFLGSLETSGVDTSKYGTPPAYNPFEKHKNVQLPAITPQVDLNTTLPSQTLKSMKKYMKLRDVYAAGGMLSVFGEGDTDDPTKPKPGEVPKHATINLTSRRLSTGSIDRDALLSDRMGEIIGQGYDPFSGTGRSILDDINRNFYGSQFATDLGTRIKSLQQDSTFQQLSPKQRMERLYSTAAGTSEFDNFLQRTRSLGGSPSAYIQGNPTMRAVGGTIRKVKYGHGGKLKPFA